MSSRGKREGGGWRIIKGKNSDPGRYNFYYSIPVSGRPFVCLIFISVCESVCVCVSVCMCVCVRVVAVCVFVFV